MSLLLFGLSIGLPVATLFVLGASDRVTTPVVVVVVAACAALTFAGVRRSIRTRGERCDVGTGPGEDADTKGQ